MNSAGRKHSGHHHQAPCAGEDSRSEVQAVSSERVGPTGKAAIAEADTQRLLCDLEIHQIELELQNEALIEARAKTEEALTRYTELYDFAPLGYFTLTPSGEMLQINLTGARLLGRPRCELIGHSFASFVAASSLNDFNVFLEQQFAGRGERAAEVTLNMAWHPLRWMRLEATLAEDRRTCRAMLSDISERRQLEAERAQQQLRLSELSRRLVTVQEDERRCLATVLHELVAPNIAALMINLRVIDEELPHDLPEDLRARIADMQALLLDTDASIQHLGADLRPAVLDFAGLVPALDSYGHRFSRRTGIAFRLVCTKAINRLSAEVESVLFRIVQESLANCAKHSGARTVTIELSHDACHALMTIADDGVGFDPQSVDRGDGRRGLGLLSMRERAEFVGARWHLESHTGRGTRITVVL